MQKKPLFLICFGLTASVGLEVAAFALQKSPAGDGPFLVIAAPWSGGATQIVKVSGGQIIGPSQAPLSVLAAGVSAEKLKETGAWAVLDPNALGLFCTEESFE